MLRISDQRPETLARCLRSVAELTERGDLRPTVGGRFTADRLAAAHDLLGGRQSTGKLVVSWS
jgi:NADPH:quinone reductase-like Zn-dependent oxidoreductase